MADGTKSRRPIIGYSRSAPANFAAAPQASLQKGSHRHFPELAVACFRGPHNGETLFRKQTSELNQIPRSLNTVRESRQRIGSMGAIRASAAIANLKSAVCYCSLASMVYKIVTEI